MPPLLKQSPEHPRLAQIRGLGLFAALKPKELRYVDRLLHERHYLPGEIVFDEGEEGQGLYIVLSGRVLICRQGEPAAGRIAEVGPGTAFGELALLSRTDFNDLLETHALVGSRISIQLARELAQKLRVHYARMDERAL